MKHINRSKSGPDASGPLFYLCFYFISACHRISGNFAAAVVSCIENNAFANTLDDYVGRADAGGEFTAFKRVPATVTGKAPYICALVSGTAA